MWRGGESIVTAGMRALDRQHLAQSLQRVRRCSQIHGVNIRRQVALLFTSRATMYMSGTMKGLSAEIIELDTPWNTA